MAEYIERQAVIDAVEFGITLASAINIETGERTELFQRENDELREAVKRIKDIEPADVVQVCRCKDCIHNNDCDIQHSAQAGDNFFCGFGETEKDVREDVYE